MNRAYSRSAAWLNHVHGDQSGSISLISVFGLLLLVMLLGLVMNGGQQIDEKIKLQNAVDAATYSSGVVFSRSMNTLAFTNHLLSDVFALTAFLREARDQSSNLFPESILDNWEKMAPTLSKSEFPKFAALGNAVTAKVPRERKVVTTYTAWAAAASESFLPVMEWILTQKAIPRFQRSLVQATPGMAQAALNEVARRHGNAWPKQVQLQGALWTTTAQTVGANGTSVLPVVDPVLGQAANQAGYKNAARQQRNDLAYRYLNDWNNETMMVFDYYAKMSQFGNLWRIFTCGQLRKLLEVEYPDDNLPHMLQQFGGMNLNTQLEQSYQFVGVVYRQQAAFKIPGLYKNPQPSDDVAYSEFMLFVPRQRLIWWNDSAGNAAGQSVPQGGVPGHTIPLPNAPQDPQNQNAGNPNDPSWYVTREDWVRRWSDEDQRYYYYQAYDRHGETWSLWNQNWTVQMVPASAPLLGQILSGTPSLSGLENVKPPSVNGLSQTDVDWISNH